MSQVLPPWQLMAELAPTVRVQTAPASQEMAELFPAWTVQLLSLQVTLAALPSTTGPPSTPQVAWFEQLTLQPLPQVPLQTLRLPQLAALAFPALISQALLWEQSSSVPAAAPPSSRPRTQLCPEAQAQTDDTEERIGAPLPCAGGPHVHAPLQTGGAGAEPQATASMSQPRATALGRPAAPRALVSGATRRRAGSTSRPDSLTS